MVIFHGKMLVYQRVHPKLAGWTPQVCAPFGGLQDLVRSLTSALQQRQLSSEEAEKRALQAEREAEGLEGLDLGLSENVV